MGSDLRMGLDPRDCRCDAAMILGDGTFGDDVNWRIQDRDKTCVWLDFIDTHFNSLVDAEADQTSVKKASTVVELEEISTQRKPSTTAETEKTYNETTTAVEIVDKDISSRIVIGETTAVRDNRTITVNIPRKNTTVVSIDSSTVNVGGD